MNIQAKIESLRAGFSKIETMNEVGAARLDAILDGLPANYLQALADAQIKWVSAKARALLILRGVAVRAPN